MTDGPLPLSAPEVRAVRAEAQPADRPIIFSAPMVRAIREGRKTMTRRVLNPQPPEGARYTGIHFASSESDSWFFNTRHGGFKVPQRFEEGDRLWVRENVKRNPDAWVYAADNVEVPWPGRADLAHRQRNSLPSIFMPRSVSRLTLTVKTVKVERLADISEDDARAEGFGWANADQDNDLRIGDPRGAFARAWQIKHGPDAWSANPWVAAIVFSAEHRNIDARAA